MNKINEIIHEYATKRAASFGLTLVYCGAEYKEESFYALLDKKGNPVRECCDMVDVNIFLDGCEYGFNLRKETA